MLDAIGQIFPLAVVVALSPLPIIGVVMILLGDDGRRRGIAMLLGRTLGILAVVIVFTLAAELVTLTSGSPTVAAVLRLLLGAGLLAFGVLKLVRRPEGEPELPGWMASLETMSAPRAFRFGFTVSAINPKELAMGAGVGVVIGGTVPEFGPALVVVLIYTLIALVGVAAPVVIVLVSGEKSTATLTGIRAWLLRHNATLMAVVLLIFGAILVGEGISALAS